MNPDSELKRKIAREAAALLYSGIEKEYKQAKVKAAATYGINFLPTNLEVALELDKLAEADEGALRKERLTRMRTEALRTMKILKSYEPVLIGSVWRGTIRRGSDIDIAVYHDDPDCIVSLLKTKGSQISKAEWVTVTKKGQPEASFHVIVEAAGNPRIEIVIRGSEEARRKRTCEIFGDELKGLNIQELTKLLKENPTRQFIPS